MLYGEKMKLILEKFGIDTSTLPDNSNYTKDLAYKAFSVVYSYFLLDVAA